MEKSIYANNIIVGLNKSIILNGINISLDNKNTIGIIGPNGSGKSTLLKTFYKIIKPISGSIYINNININEISQNRCAQYIAVLPQNKSNEGESEFTVFEIVSMGLYATQYLHKYTQNDITIKINKTLSSIGILELANRKINQISGGERQLVMLARAIIQNTPFLLLDEPTNHLDVLHQVLILDLIISLNKKVIIVFHDLIMAAKYCDYIYLMNKGKIHIEGKPEIVLTEKNIFDVYKLVPTIINHPVTNKLLVIF
jgi:iron complex transport system ATP-binding protein